MEALAVAAILTALAIGALAIWRLRRRRHPRPKFPRGPRGRPYPTSGGLWVRSRGEQRIANALAARGILFEYEPQVLTFCPDFRLLDAQVLIEYWGGAAYRKYESHMLDKIAAYEAAGWKVISLFPAHLHELERVLDEQLKAAGITW